MNHYHYKAASLDGAILRGFIEAEGINAVHDSIASKGLYVIDVKMVAPSIVKVKRILSPQKIKRRDIIEFSYNLSVMLRAGLPLLIALGDIAVTTENKYLYTIITDIKRQTEMGMRFSDAVDFYRGVFPDVFVRLVRVGEETGRFDKSLSDIASHLQKMEDLSAVIKRALIYPAFALVTTGGAMIFWLVYVLPNIMKMLKETGVKLPLITRILLHVSEAAQAHWYLIPAIPISIFIIVQVMKHQEGTRYYIDRLKLKLPIVKLIVYNKLLALFSEQLRILIVAGITIDRSLSIISDVIGNSVFKRAITSSMDSIAGGSTISEALREQGVFPPMVIRMVNVGEASGTLDEQFAFLSDYYMKKLDDISKRMEKMIEPVIIVVVGLVFAVIIIGLMMPLYDMVSVIGK